MAARDEDEEIQELPPTWEELEELLRYPGHVDLEAFVWTYAERMGAMAKPPPHAGPKTPKVRLPKLVDQLLKHYNVGDDTADEAREALTAGLLRVDLDFDERG
jgi:hypothetical protein